MGTAKILGIDPGSRVLGFAILAAKNAEPRGIRDYRVEDVGAFKVSERQAFMERTLALHDAVAELLEAQRPTLCVMETCFFGKNAQSALKLGLLRGTLLAALHRQDIPCIEVAPSLVKRLVSGHGHAAKEQVAYGLESLLGFKRGALPFDASDALSIALAYVLHASVLQPSSLSSVARAGSAGGSSLGC